MRRTAPFLIALAAVLLVGVWGWNEVVSPALDGGGGDDVLESPIVSRETVRPAVPPGAGAHAEPAKAPPLPPPQEHVEETHDADAAPEPPDDAVSADDVLPADGEGNSGSTVTQVGTLADAVPVAGAVDDWKMVGNTGSVDPDDEAEVPKGWAWLGSSSRWVEGVIQTRGRNAPVAMAYEAPRHRVFMGPYFIEMTEVSNQRYKWFLVQTAAVEFETPLGNASTLAETVVELVGSRAPQDWDVDVTARQLYESNRGALHVALPDAVQYDEDGQLEEDATWAKFRETSLPSEVRLRFYERAPPEHWPSDTFPPGEVAHPARGLSMDDAVALALWAGKHVPTEQEWEYACRGPNGWDYPWGMDGRDFDVRVNGGFLRERDFKPSTVSVRSYRDGASWVGCLHMLGNVSEWTSSWLEPYPGSTLPPIPIVVVRGGSAEEVDRLLVRPALRGWRPGDPHPRPLFRNCRPWTGVRLARYEEVGRSRLPCMHARVRAARELPPQALEQSVYAALLGEIRKDYELARDDPGARRGTKSFVVQPLRAVVLPAGAKLPEHPDPKHPDSEGSDPAGEIQDTEDLVKRSADGPVLLGLAHADLGLINTWRAAGTTRNGRLRLQRTWCPPGTWILALDRGHLALLSPDFGDAYYLTRRPVTSASVSVGARTPTASAAALRPKLMSGAVEATLTVPLEHVEGGESVGVGVRFRLEVDRSILELVDDWEQGP